MMAAFGFILAFVCGALAVVHPLIPVVGVVVAAAAFWTVSRPHHLLMVFCGVLFSRPSELMPALEPLSIPKLTALGAMLSFAVARAWRRDASFADSPFHLPVAMLVVAVFLSSLLSVNQAESMAQFNDVFVKIVIVYVLVVHLIDTPQRVGAWLTFLSCVTALMAVYSLYAKWTGLILVEGSRAAYVGSLGDSNDFALVVFLYIPFLAQRVLDAVGSKRIAFGLLLAIHVVSMAATQSRGGFLGLTLASGIMFLTRVPKRYWWTALPMAFVMLLALALLSGSTGRSSGSVGAEQIDESAQGRLDAWDAAIRMLMRHPVLGVGFGRFAQSYERFCVNPVIWGEHETHNTYLKVAAETGLTGLAPFLTMVGLGVRNAFVLRTSTAHAGDPGARAAMLAAFPTIVGVCLITFFLSQSWSWYWYVLIAQIAAMERLQRVFTAAATRV